MATFVCPNYRAPRNKRSISPQNDPFEKVTVYILRGQLEQMTKLRGTFVGFDDVTLGSMIGVAIDNELQSANPFDHSIEIDMDAPRVEFGYADEAGKMLDFIRRLPKGGTLQTVFQGRWNYGVPDLALAKAAFRELLDNNLIEIIEGNFSNGRPSRRVRAISVTPQYLKKSKYRRVAGQSTRYGRTIKDDEVER